MKRRVFIGLGAASIGAGALHSTGALSSLSAGRGIAVNAADDQANALLGIDNAEESPAEFTNNAGVDLSIDIKSDQVNFDPSSFLIESSDEDGEEVEFEGEGAAKICAELIGDEKVGSITLEKSFKNPLLRELDGSAEGGGPNGKYDFEIENTGDIAVDITGLGIDSTSTDATEVANGLSADGEVVIDELEVGSGIVGFSQNVQIGTEAGSNTVSFEFSQFRESGVGGNTNMSGATVEITIEYTDPDGESFATPITLIDDT